ncbi:hydrolase [Erwinia sp. OLTSP20]|uniref:fumarylacetoacetate hydrolase family protein n=1 Tax=unclassified Erwinia TaxID=2622719 RepID=UPI000C191644|nr:MULTISPECIES: fumarylacetoacetate hydrolase family protein [unclassified Erwinia]PIJ50137.1 hydrolase [Erwinia sp. OAMSP11]PIJ71903.1 hydrolase [Erwinia sp. OLSSP12]PIJ81105.1 hydrolase [Erwinia sp. OLCASP19]PIJ83535.1 hydrolase [Erwinia sp. OLMTSP26]PIJ86150.1 hydrolase [Erwinia sp. OLMDSP33]
MKLVSYYYQDNTHIGVIDHDGNIIDVTEIAQTNDMNLLIDRFAELKGRLTDCCEGANRAALSPQKVRLLAPIPMTRRNIFCVGKNYYAHAQEFASSGYDSSAAAGNVPAHPIIFSKPATSISGPDDAIDSRLDPHNSLDYEAELAVVLGKRGRVTDQDDPLSYIFGYTLINDLTSRFLQKQHSQWLLGKGIDGFCPMGPVLVTADEFGEPGRQEIRCTVNGELRQQAQIADLIFTIPTLIKTIGQNITLLPGDVIATGTPAGVGLGFTPPRYLKKGDKVVVSMNEIGQLVNTII